MLYVSSSLDRNVRIRDRGDVHEKARKLIVILMIRYYAQLETSSCITATTTAAIATTTTIMTIPTKNTRRTQNIIKQSVCLRTNVHKIRTNKLQV